MKWILVQWNQPLHTCALRYFFLLEINRFSSLFSSQHVSNNLWSKNKNKTKPKNSYTNKKPKYLYTNVGCHRPGAIPNEITLLNWSWNYQKPSTLLYLLQKLSRFNIWRNIAIHPSALQKWFCDTEGCDLYTCRSLDLLSRLLTSMFISSWESKNETSQHVICPVRSKAEPSVDLILSRHVYRYISVRAKATSMLAFLLYQEGKKNKSIFNPDPLPEIALSLHKTHACLTHSWRISITVNLRRREAIHFHIILCTENTLYSYIFCVYRENYKQ